jgi:hypothetical protein
MLAEKAGVAKEQIRLILRGSPMVDDKTLADQKVKAGDTIHMIMQMRGGRLLLGHHIHPHVITMVCIDRCD